MAHKQPSSNNSHPAASSLHTGVNRMRLENLIIVEKHPFAGPNKVDDCQNEHMVMICSKIGNFLNADDHGKSGNLSAVEMVFTLEINIMADRRIPINIPMNVEGKFVNLYLDTGCCRWLLS